MQFYFSFSGKTCWRGKISINPSIAYINGDPQVFGINSSYVTATLKGILQ